MKMCTFSNPNLVQNITAFKFVHKSKQKKKCKIGHAYCVFKMGGKFFCKTRGIGHSVNSQYYYLSK